MTEELNNQYKCLLEELKTWDNKTDEEKEISRDEQEFDLLEFVTRTNDNIDAKRFEATIIIGWPNIFVKWRDTQDGGDFTATWWSDRVQMWLTQSEMDLFIDMYNIYID